MAVDEIALALADAGRDVLVVDLGLDGPSFQKPFQYQPDEGIVDMALFGTSAGAALRKTPHERIRVVRSIPRRSSRRRNWRRSSRRSGSSGARS
jgi:hypothetical protein